MGSWKKMCNLQLLSVSRRLCSVALLLCSVALLLCSAVANSSE